jgi:hypothetical protein
MLLKDTFVEQSIVEKLRQFNIRNVEQLLNSSDNERRIMVLSTALEMPRAELVQLITNLKEQYPQLIIGSSPRRRYYKGYRVEDSALENLFKK